MAVASRPRLVPGTHAYFDKVAKPSTAPVVPDLMQQGARSSERAHHLRSRDRLQPPGVPASRSSSPPSWSSEFKESAPFNATIVVIKVAVVLFVIALGIHVCEHRQLGARLGSPSRPSASPASARRPPIYSSPISGSTPSRPPRRKPRTHSATCPSASSRRLLVCTALYILVAGVLTGMVPWQRGEHRSAHRPRFSGSRLDRRLARHHRRSAGRTNQRNAGDAARPDPLLYSMANDGLLPKKFFADIHPKFRTPWKNTMLVGLLAAIVGSLTPSTTSERWSTSAPCWHS